jgi:hypothetical protein
MRHRVRLLAIALLLLCSCSYEARLAPFVRGTVLEKHAPAAGVEVTLSVTQDDYACEHVSRRTVTDAQGEFRLQAIKSRIWLAIGDPLLQWHLCLNRDGRRFRGLTTKDVGSAQDVEVVSCELDQPETGGAGEVCVPTY